MLARMQGTKRKRTLPPRNVLEEGPHTSILYVNIGAFWSPTLVTIHLHHGNHHYKIEDEEEEEEEEGDSNEKKDEEAKASAVVD